MDRKITILGAGSSGMATAAWLTRAGFEITLWDTPEQSEDFEEIRKNGGIRVTGGSGMNGMIMPAHLSNDLEEALLHTDRIIVCTSASRHREVAEACAPLVREGQAFLLAPGNFGSIIFQKVFDAAQKTGVLLAEVCGGFWACRRTAPGEVVVTGPLKESVKFAAFPSEKNEEVKQCFDGILPLAPGTNVFEVSLNSPNVISHVCGAVLNVAGIERKGDAYAFFLDGLSASVIKCFGQLEKERNTILNKLGMKVYSETSRPFMEKLMTYDQYRELDLFRSLDGPSSFEHRYVAEDASCGVAMLVSLGRQYQEPMPLTEAMLTVASAITDEPYLETGRTLETLGLSELTKEELLCAL